MPSSFSTSQIFPWQRRKISTNSCKSGGRRKKSGISNCESICVWHPQHDKRAIANSSPQNGQRVMSFLPDSCVFFIRYFNLLLNILNASIEKVNVFSFLLDLSSLDSLMRTHSNFDTCRELVKKSTNFLASLWVRVFSIGMVRVASHHANEN